MTSHGSCGHDYEYLKGFVKQIVAHDQTTFVLV